MAIKLVIFDMDGTIVNTAESYMYSVNKVLEEENLPIHSLEDYMGWMGGGFTKFVEDALPVSKRNEGYIHELAQRVDEVYGENLNYNVKVYDGIYKLLNALVDKGIAIAINTNKIDDKAKQMAKEFFSDYDFVEVIGKSDNVPVKPNPRGAQIIIEKTKKSPEDTMYVGDSQYDIETAMNAGVTSVAVGWGYRDRKELQKAKYFLDHPLDLLDYLGF